MVSEVTDANFEKEVIEASKVLPVLVDFWAEWCGPCRQLAPIVEEIATSLEGKLKVVKITIDEHPETPSKLGVSGIPTLMIFKNGTCVANRTGSLPKSALMAWVNENL